jgi:hypothetical protein
MVIRVVARREVRERYLNWVFVVYSAEGRVLLGVFAGYTTVMTRLISPGHLELSVKDAERVKSWPAECWRSQEVLGEPA